MSYKDAIYWLKQMLSLCGESLVPIKEALNLAIYVLEKADDIVGAIEYAPTIATKQIKYYDEDENVWKIGEVIVDE